jgi:hypothetical protein
MKTLSFLLVSLFVCLTTIGRPEPDLSKDAIFIKLTNEILSEQSKNNSSFNNIGIAVLALKNKYAALNDKACASSMINAALDKMYGKSNFACHRELLKAVINCIKTSTDRATLSDCVREAYAEFVVCISTD